MKSHNRWHAPVVAATIVASTLGATSSVLADTPSRSTPAAASTIPADETAAPKRKYLLDILFGPREAELPETTGSISTGRTETTRSRRVAGPTPELRALIRKHAAAAGVPAELAEAVINVESRFNPRARGRAGEIGLMQIKPSTARAIGYSGSAAGLYDPATNLTWGMRYLATAYQLAGGDTCGAILRYNGGHAARKMTGAVRTYCRKVNTYVAAL